MNNDSSKPAGAPTHSAPPDDDPVQLHIIHHLSQLTGRPPAKGQDPGIYPTWQLTLACIIRRLLTAAKLDQIRRLQHQHSQQTTYEQGMIIATPFQTQYIAGRHIADAVLHPDGRTATALISNGRRTILRPSRRAPQFVATVNRYSRSG